MDVGPTKHTRAPSLHREGRIAGKAPPATAASLGEPGRGRVVLREEPQAARGCVLVRSPPPAGRLCARSSGSAVPASALSIYTVNFN